MVLISTLGIIFIPAYVGFQVISAKNINKYINSNDFKTLVIWAVVIMVLLFVAQVPLKRLKILFRRNTEYTDEGKNKKYSNYDNLSRSERNAIDKKRLEKLELIVDTNTIKGLTHSGSKNPEEDMQTLRGMEDVKEEMKLMVARMKITPSKEKNLSTNHMCFLGSAGTGKTTVARIMTGFLYKYKYINQNKCLEIDGNFLKEGQFTQLKTERIVRSAFGGVLFIDEAYALIEGGDDGLEALATLVKLMEDYRDKFVLILAGYTSDMKVLLLANQGLHSRIKHYLYFSDYSVDELAEIFVSMAKKQNYEVSDDAIRKIKERMEIEKNTNTFGNARTVRNILDKSIDLHALNFTEGLLDKKQKRILTGIDIAKRGFESQMF